MGWDIIGYDNVRHKKLRGSLVTYSQSEPLKQALMWLESNTIILECLEKSRLPNIVHLIQGSMNYR